MMRKSTASNCTIAAAMFLLFGCETDRSETAIDADIAAIKTVSKQAAEAWKARDWNTFAGFYTDDTIWMPPGDAPLRGKDALRAWLGTWWDESTTVEITSTPEEIVVIDDWAFERHIESQILIDEVGGEPMQYYYKGIWILRRQEEGSWKVARYIWNENVPPD